MFTETLEIKNKLLEMLLKPTMTPVMLVTEKNWMLAQEAMNNSKKNGPSLKTIWPLSI